MCVRACVFVGKCTNQIQKKMIFYATFFSLCWEIYISSPASFSFCPQCFCTMVVPQDGICSAKYHLDLLPFSTQKRKWCLQRARDAMTPVCFPIHLPPPPPVKSVLGTFSQEPPGGSALGQSEEARAAALLPSTCEGRRRGVPRLRLDASSSVHPRPLWAPSAVPVLILPPHKVLEPLESSSKLCWFLVKVPPLFAPKTQKHFFFSFLLVGRRSGGGP